MNNIKQLKVLIFFCVFMLVSFTFDKFALLQENKVIALVAIAFIIAGAIEFIFRNRKGI